MVEMSFDVKMAGVGGDADFQAGVAGGIEKREGAGERWGVESELSCDVALAGFKDVAVNLR